LFLIPPRKNIYSGKGRDRGPERINKKIPRGEAT